MGKVLEGHTPDIPVTWRNSPWGRAHRPQRPRGDKKCCFLPAWRSPLVLWAVGPQPLLRQGLPRVPPVCSPPLGAALNVSGHFLSQRRLVPEHLSWTHSPPPGPHPREAAFIFKPATCSVLPGTGRPPRGPASRNGGDGTEGLDWVGGSEEQENGGAWPRTRRWPGWVLGAGGFSLRLRRSWASGRQAPVHSGLEGRGMCPWGQLPERASGRRRGAPGLATLPQGPQATCPCKPISPRPGRELLPPPGGPEPPTSHLFSSWPGRGRGGVGRLPQWRRLVVDTRARPWRRLRSTLAGGRRPSPGPGVVRVSPSAPWHPFRIRSVVPAAPFGVAAAMSLRVLATHLQWVSPLLGAAAQRESSLTCLLAQRLMLRIFAPQ